VGKIFISYRRDDTQDITRSIYERLAARFGADNIFMDVDSIPLGADFRQILRNAVASSSLALVIIGKLWLSISDERGQRRLDNPNDFVRIEVEEALARKIPVVPILTHGTPMPRFSDLPASIADLAYRHGTDVRSDHHFNHDVEQLLARLVPLMATPGPQPAAPQKPIYPLPTVPARLASLGFRGVHPNGAPAIVPPLVSVAAGPFLMGSDKSHDKEAFDKETPQHRIELAAFQIGKYPVTVAEYQYFLTATQRAAPVGQYNTLTWDQQARERPDHPVVNVSWQDATAYVAWLRKVTGQPNWRLPSEAQWEKAARWDAQRNVSRIYPWGDSFDNNRCNTAASGIQTTTPVGSYPASDARRSGASPWRAEEMAGNVWEWTSSLFKPYKYIENDGRETQDSTGNRMLRGGSWFNYARLARAAYRVNVSWDYLGDDDGFRLSVSASAG
jgi:formylglycine-generating enzyme required for sulfatase activity